MTERLVRRRTHAERLAQQNARLFSEQRSVAQTLQHSLLPEELPEFPGLELAVRYVAGVDGVEIGGDWYDVIGVDDGHIDRRRGRRVGPRPCGPPRSWRRCATRSARTSAEGDGPAAILVKLSKLISVDQDGHFATVLCGLVDVADHTVTYRQCRSSEPVADRRRRAPNS